MKFMLCCLNVSGKIKPLCASEVWALTDQSSWVLVRNWRSKIYILLPPEEDLLFQLIPGAASLVLVHRTFLENILSRMEKWREKEIGAGVALRDDHFAERPLSCPVQSGPQTTGRPELSFVVSQSIWDMKTFLSEAKGIFLSLVNLLPLLKKKKSFSSSFIFSPLFKAKRKGKGPFCCVCVLIFKFFNLFLGGAS